MRNVYKILVGIPERKSIFRRTRRRYKENQCLKEATCGAVDWIGLSVRLL
jgi:hypothetical protein